MKAIATKQFINKYSKALVKEGSVVEVSEKRFKEINEAGFGVLLLDSEADDMKIVEKEPKKKDEGKDSGGKEK